MLGLVYCIRMTHMRYMKKQFYQLRSQ
uniref:Uncharacterized protein n=1 Tax=Rhizophora mucronata TaxID=61149 RepID=A0A2P2Q850_RHIMU